MYGQVAGAGFTAGVPAALAFTGITSRSFALMIGVALAAILVGVSLLRVAYARR